MTPTEAVGFLSQAAWKNHDKDCLAVKTRSDAKCTCGSVQHNKKVKEALMTIGGAARKG